MDVVLTRVGEIVLWAFQISPDVDSSAAGRASKALVTITGKAVSLSLFCSSASTDSDLRSPDRRVLSMG